MTTIEELWTVQRLQQQELGLDPRHQDLASKLRLSADLSTQVSEDGSMLGRLFGAHKRHLLRQPQVSKHNVAELCADVAKSVIALAQLHGVTSADFVEAFHAKSRVVAAKSAQERHQLLHDTRLACFDLDDVICDISPWTRHLASLRGTAPPNAKTLAMMEEYKHEFYHSGRFGAEFTPVVGAIEGVRTVKELGYSIVIITARPQWQYKRLFGDTIAWFERHQIPIDFLFFNKDKVEAVHSHLAPAWPTLFVEDHPRNVDALAAAGVNVLLFDRPHNADYHPPESVRRVTDWESIVKAFKEKR